MRNGVTAAEIRNIICALWRNVGMERKEKRQIPPFLFPTKTLTADNFLIKNRKILFEVSILTAILLKKLSVQVFKILKFVLISFCNLEF